METTFSITNFSHDEIVMLFSDATYYGNELYVRIPEEYKHLADKGEGNCIEDMWANVLLNNGQLEIYDLFDNSNSEEESKLNGHGEVLKNWLHTRYDSEEKVTVYTINLETLLRGLSCRAAMPCITDFFIREEGDRFTAYNIIQIAVFGDIIYG